MRVERERQEILLVFMISFLIGIFYTNFVAGDYVTITGIFYEGFIDQYTRMEFVTKDYLFYLLKNRTMPLIIFSIAATTKYRKATSLVVLFWTGFAGGVLAVTSVLRMGGTGILVCIAALFPHFLFYAMEYFMIIWYCYTYPDISWNRWKTSFVVIMHFTGILVEGYLNPQILRLLIQVFL